MQKSRLVMLLAILIIMGCATEKAEITRQASMAQEKCDAPTYRIGDTWKYRTESGKFWSEKVAKIEDNLVYIEYIEGKHTRGLDAKTLQSKIEIDRSGVKRKIPESEALFYDFPLYVGKKWSKTIRGTTWPDDVNAFYLMDSRVIAFEEITVPAGKFKTFKIEVVQSASGTTNSASVYFWYSPDVKQNIKVKFGTSYGPWRITSIDYELFSYGLTP